MKRIPGPPSSPDRTRGAALLLSFMILLILILILAQIRYSTDTAARVARNEETLISMNHAIESCLLQVFEDLKTDGEAAGAAGEDTGGAGALGDGGGDLGGGAGGAATDSREDAWARPQRTEINQIQLRVLVQDEDSKFNVLSVLTEDDDEADKALDRLTRILEFARKGTEAEIDGTAARRMATAMKEYMERRDDQGLPRPVLLSDGEDRERGDQGLPLTLREFVGLDPELFPKDLFRDHLDERGNVVHSLGTFLTVWTTVETAEDAARAPEDTSGTEPPPQDDPNQNDDPNEDPNEDPNANPDDGETPTPDAEGETPQQGGEDSTPAERWAINVNTAPAAVLRGLVEDRDLPYRFWDDVILFRNEKDESVEQNEDPPLDEYGREILVKQFFQSAEDLSKIDGWDQIEPVDQGELQRWLKAESNVFSIFVTARKPTGDEQIGLDSRRDDIRREEANWQGLVRTVRCVVWRRVLGQGEVEIVPLVWWEVLDYTPLEVLDFPEDEGYTR